MLMHIFSTIRLFLLTCPIILMCLHSMWSFIFLYFQYRNAFHTSLTTIKWPTDCQNGTQEISSPAGRPKRASAEAEPYSWQNPPCQMGHFKLSKASSGNTAGAACPFSRDIEASRFKVFCWTGWTKQRSSPGGKVLLAWLNTLCLS